MDATHLLLRAGLLAFLSAATVAFAAEPTSAASAGKAHALPAPTRIARIAAVRASQQPALASAGCDDDAPLRALDDAWALDSQHELLFVGCMRGAYNTSVVAFLVTDGQAARAQVLALTVPPIEGIAADDLPFPLQRLGRAHFDPRQLRLSETTLYRGAGDCGHAARWRWTGTAFQLETLQLQPSCDNGPRGQWPTVWPEADASAG